MIHQQTSRSRVLSRAVMSTLVGVVVLSASAGASQANRIQRPIPDAWVARWRADLAFVLDSVPPRHPSFFNRTSRQQFGAALARLGERLPDMAHHEITTELARIMVLVGDGHTRLTLPFDSTAGFFTGHSSTPPPAIEGLIFRQLPIRLWWFADGMFVVRASEEQRSLLGHRVVGIGAVTTEDAIQAVRPTVHRDNPSQVRGLMPTWLVVPEILAARGVVPTPDRVDLRLASASGETRTVTLSPVPPGQAVRWLDARNAGDPPLATSRAGQAHWFTAIPQSGAVYARFHEVLDTEERTVDRFATDLFEYVAAHDVSRLILDLRDNVGGNGFLNLPLVRGLMRAVPLWGPGGLTVLIDRGTFSAAVMLAADLESQTPAIFLGEPTAGKPNAYGDSRKIQLPNSGLTVRVSTLYHQKTRATDDRDAITPLMTVEPSYADYQENRDPVLERAILLGSKGGELAGTWTGTVGLLHQRSPVRLVLTRDGARWSGTVDLAGLGLRQARVAGTEAGGRLSFALAVPGTTPGLAELEVGERFGAGVIRAAGAVFPFVIERQTP